MSDKKKKQKKREEEEKKQNTVISAIAHGVSAHQLPVTRSTMPSWHVLSAKKSTPCR